MMNRIELKQEAKGVVRTAAVSAYLFALLYLALTELLQGASVYVNGDVALYMQTYFPNVPIPSYLYPVALPTTVVRLVAVVCWLLRVLLQGAGCCTIWACAGARRCLTPPSSTASASSAS